MKHISKENLLDELREKILHDVLFQKQSKELWNLLDFGNRKNQERY